MLFQKCLFSIGNRKAAAGSILFSGRRRSVLTGRSIQTSLSEEG